MALWGAAILDKQESDVGTFWMLATDALSNEDDEIFALSRLVIDDMLSTFSALENYVDTRSQAFLQLLARLGFAVTDGVTDEGTGRILHYVRIERGETGVLAN